MTASSKKIALRESDSLKRRILYVAKYLLIVANTAQNLKTLPSFQEYKIANQETSVNNCVLTEREYQVTSLVAQGLSRKEIADRLSTSLSAVSCYLCTALKKLGIQKFELPILFATNPPKFKDWFYEEKIKQFNLPTSASIAAEKMGCSYMTAYKLLKRKGLLLTQKRRVVNLDGQNYSLNELSKLTGVDSKSLYRRIYLQKWSVDEAIQGKRKRAENPIFKSKAKKIIELYSQGFTKTDILLNLDVSLEYVSKIIRKYKILTGDTLTTSDKVLNLYSSEMSRNEIARIVGITYQYVCSIIRSAEQSY